jgi:hypothetical protein
MNISRPIWYLKIACPICEQGSALVILSCPNCKNLIVECEEEGSLFLNVNNILSETAISQDKSNECCPQCKKCKLSEFRIADDNEIRNHGLTQSEYE